MALYDPARFESHSAQAHDCCLCSPVNAAGTENPMQGPLEIKNNHFTEMCSGSEAGSFLRLIDSCITQLKAQGPSRTCNESKEEKSCLCSPVNAAGTENPMQGSLETQQEARPALQQTQTSICVSPDGKQIPRHRKQRDPGGVINPRPGCSGLASHLPCHRDHIPDLHHRPHRPSCARPRTEAQWSRGGGGHPLSGGATNEGGCARRGGEWMSGEGEGCEKEQGQEGWERRPERGHFVREI